MNIRYRVDLERGRAHAAYGVAERRQAPGAQTQAGANLVGCRTPASADEAIASSVSVSASTVYAAPNGVSLKAIWQLALSEEARPGATRKLSGKETALLVATACSSPPHGRKRWTLDLLAGAMIRLTEHQGLSRETVRRRLAEDDLKPWRRMTCGASHTWTAGYVARMEDVLDLYAEEADLGAPGHLL